MKAARAMGGVATGGLVALTLLVLGSSVLGRIRGYPGPSASAIGWHLGVAILAVAVQVWADRGAATRGAVAAVAVIGLAAVLLWTQWWA